jgi:hypothetical protein
MASPLRPNVGRSAGFGFSFPGLPPGFHIFEGEFFEDPLLGHVSLMDGRPGAGLLFTHTVPALLAG